MLFITYETIFLIIEDGVWILCVASGDKAWSKYPDVGATVIARRHIDYTPLQINISVMKDDLPSLWLPSKMPGGVKHISQTGSLWCHQAGRSQTPSYLVQLLLLCLWMLWFDTYICFCKLWMLFLFFSLVINTTGNITLLDLCCTCFAHFLSHLRKSCGALRWDQGAADMLLGIQKRCWPPWVLKGSIASGEVTANWAHGWYFGGVELWKISDSVKGFFFLYCVYILCFIDTN